MSKLFAQTEGTKIQPEVFLTEVSLNPPMVMDIRAFGSWTSAPKREFLQDFEGLAKFLPSDVRRDIRVDVRRISGPKTYSLGCFFIPEDHSGKLHIT